MVEAMKKLWENDSFIFDCFQTLDLIELNALEIGFGGSGMLLK